MLTDRSLADTTLAVCRTAREHPYRAVHKGLRLLMAHTLAQAGRADAADAGERAALVADVERLLATCADHLAHEDRFFHAPLRRRAARAVAAFDAEHQAHLAAIDALRRALQGLRDSHGSEASARAQALMLELSRFVAENLEHMADEETALTAALWQHFGDDEIRAMQAALRGSLSPDEAAFYRHWIEQGLSRPELRALHAGAAAAAAAAA